MTYSELNKLRRYVPFAIFAICVLPWFWVRLRNIDDLKLYNELIIPVIAVIMAFFYNASGLRKKRWESEMDNHVRKQIREELLSLVPSHLAISPDEQRLLQAEAYKDLTGVFWEAVDKNETLRSHEEHWRGRNRKRGMQPRGKSATLPPKA